MRNSKLTRMKMIEIQKNIADKKAAILASGETK